MPADLTEKMMEKIKAQTSALIKDNFNTNPSDAVYQLVFSAMLIGVTIGMEWEDRITQIAEMKGAEKHGK